jgi:hypothetical protein
LPAATEYIEVLCLQTYSAPSGAVTIQRIVIGN